MRDWPLTLPDWAETPDQTAGRRWVQSFCEQWSQKDFFLQPLLGELWQIYDLTDPDESPLPWFYISYIKTIWDQDPEMKAEIILKSLECLQTGFDAALLAQLRHMLYQFPPHVRVSSIGIKQGPQGPFARIYSEYTHFSALLDMLKVLRWPGNLSDLQMQMNEWADRSIAFGLSLDLHEGIQPKIGIECHFDDAQLTRQMGAFTDALCVQGLCTRAQQEALLAWDGYCEIPSDTLQWSWADRYQTGAEVMPPEQRIKRMNRYIKMVYEPGKPLLAKAYLFFSRLSKWA
jgi:hypothetical protein